MILRAKREDSTALPSRSRFDAVQNKTRECRNNPTMIAQVLMDNSFECIDGNTNVGSSF